MKQYDLIVIGSGPGGQEAAARAASEGKSVALIEKGLLGGTCLNRGCIPTKCLCAAAERLWNASHSEEFGIVCDGIHADFGAAARRAHEIVASIRQDVANAFADIDVFQGEARVAEGRTVVVGANFLKGREIIIATGSKPAPFPAAGAEYVENSDDFLLRETLPESVVIVGGGVIGLEFASVISSFGVPVTVVEFCPEILPGFDAEVAKRLRSYLGRHGVKFAVGARVIAVEKAETTLAVRYESRGKEISVSAETVINATGRRPVLPEGLEEAGIKLTARGFIETDENFATTAPGVFAIGDVNGRCMLAHAASAQARVVAGKDVHPGIIPAVVFTNPECASVGHCVADSDAFKAAKVPYSANGKALAAGEDEGFVKLVYDASSGVITGCQALGAHAGDLVAVATLAIDRGMTVADLAVNTVAAHPTFSELLQSAAAAAVRAMRY